jgi:hypothetical protein
VTQLFELGTYLRVPGGNVENVAEHQAAGVEWELCNIGGDVNHDPAVWDNQRRIYGQHAMPYGPWMHCHSLADIAYVVSTAVKWQADLVGINIEDIEGFTLQQVGEYLRTNWTNPVHMATLPWLNNGAGWKHVAFATQALELFPLEQPFWAQPEIIAQCIGHAFQEGAQRVTLLYSTTSPRSAYPAAIAHCLYTADNVTDWSEWHDTVPQLPPVPSAPSPPPKPLILTPAQFPYTGPLVVGTINRSSVKGLKRGLIRGGYLVQPLGSETDDFGPTLEKALQRLQRDKGITPASGKYGQRTWLIMCGLRVPAGTNKGRYAMDAKALAYVRKDVA